MTIDTLVDPRAVEEGRVFIGRVRAKRGARVRAGEEIRVDEGETADLDIVILHKAAGLVAVDKPSGISTIPDEHDAASSLLHRTARELEIDPALLHPTSRLDRDVSGIVVFAFTASGRQRLQDARTSGRYFRLYVAIAERAPASEKGEWNVPIGRAKSPKKRAANGRDAVPARTKFRITATAAGRARLELEPITGRTHQIRVHASHAGAPLLGDRDYGGSRTLVLPSGSVIALDRIALHCAHVRVEGLIDVKSPEPEIFETWWSKLK